MSLFFQVAPWSSAWSSKLETGMSHFFGVAPRGVPRGVPFNPGVTTGLKEAILDFFSWESLGAGLARAGWRTRSAKNMFIRSWRGRAQCQAAV